MSNQRTTKTKVRDLGILKRALQKAKTKAGAALFTVASNADVKGWNDRTSIAKAPLAFNFAEQGKPLRFGFAKEKGGTFKLTGDAHWLPSNKSNNIHSMDELTKRINSLYNFEAMLQYATANNLQVTAKSPAHAIANKAELEIEIEA